MVCLKMYKQIFLTHFDTENKKRFAFTGTVKNILKELYGN